MMAARKENGPPGGRSVAPSSPSQGRKHLQDIAWQQDVNVFDARLEPACTRPSSISSVLSDPTAERVLVGTMLDVGPVALDAIASLPSAAFASFANRAIVDAARRVPRPAAFERQAWLDAVATELDRAGLLSKVGLAELFRMSWAETFGSPAMLWHFVEKVLGLFVRRELHVAYADATAALADGTPVREVMASIDAAHERARTRAKELAAVEASHPSRRTVAP